MSQADYDAAQLNRNEDQNTAANLESSTNSDENDAADSNHNHVNGQVGLSGAAVDDSAGSLADDTLSLQQTHMTNGHVGGDGSSSPNGVGSDGVVGEGEGGAMAVGDSQGSSEGDQEYNSEGFDPDLRRVKVHLISSKTIQRMS